MNEWKEKRPDPIPFEFHFENRYLSITDRAVFDWIPCITSVTRIFFLHKMAKKKHPDPKFRFFFKFTTPVPRCESGGGGGQRRGRALPRAAPGAPRQVPDPLVLPERRRRGQDQNGRPRSDVGRPAVAGPSPNGRRLGQALGRWVETVPSRSNGFHPPPPKSTPSFESQSSRVDWSFQANISFSRNWTGTVSRVTLSL